MGKVVDALVDGTPLGKLVFDAVGIDAWWEIGVGKYLREAMMPSMPDDFENEAMQQQQMLRSSTEARRSIYGRAMVSGPIVFSEETGNDNEYLHLVLPLASHECEAVDAIYFNDELAFENNVVRAPFVDHARINVHLGNQLSADADLVNECVNWTERHVGRGITYLAVRLKHDQEVFSSGVPNVKAIVRGKPVYDPRKDSTVGGMGSHRWHDSSTWEWSNNWALCVLDFTLFESGIGADISEINLTAYALAANDSDELVEYDDEGNCEARYTCNGTFTQSMTPASILDKLLLAGAGMQTYVSGQYHLYAGVYQGPAVMDITEDDLAGEVSIRSFTPRASLCNAVRGTFVDPDNHFQPTDFPPYESSYYQAQDNGEYIDHDIDLAFTQSIYTAQRLAKLYLELNRAGQQLTLSLNMIGLGLAVGKVVNVNLPRLGINKAYSVVDWAFDFGKPIKVVLKETHPDLFDYDKGSYTARKLTPPLNLPNASNVPTVANLSWEAMGDDANWQGLLSWSAPGGNSSYRYRLEITDTSDRLVYQASPDISQHYVPKLDVGTYTCKVWAVNLFSNRSNVPAELSIGSDAPPPVVGIEVIAGALELVLKPQTAVLIANTTTFELLGSISNDFAGAAYIGSGKEIIWPSLHPNTGYFVWARSKNNYGVSSYFGPRNVQTSSDNTSLVALLGDSFKSYSWFAWADDNQGTGFTTNESQGENKPWMGIATDKETPTASGNWQDYTWSKIQTEIPPVFTPEEETQLDNIMAGRLPDGSDDLLALQAALNNSNLSNNLLNAQQLLNQGISAFELGGETPAGALLKAQTAETNAVNTALETAKGDPLLSNNVTENNVTRIARPQGGTYSLREYNALGAIKITLPVWYSSTMLSFYVDVYDYREGKSFSLYVAGYNYGATPTWKQHTAKIIGDSQSDHAVRFGDDGEKCCIWIGDANSLFYYPKVAVRDVQAGYSSYEITRWQAGWQVSQVSEFDNVQHVVTDNIIGSDMAQLKASAAQAAAESYALAKANLVETTAAAYADGRVDAEEQRAIEDATAKAEAAKQAAINAAALDAAAKAQAAQTAAESYAQAKATLAETTAKAHADGRVDAEEQRAIEDATAKADAAKQAAIDAAALDAEAKAQAAQTAAESYAQAKANLAETTAKAHADGKVDAEEQRAIEDATAKAEAAKAQAIAAAALDATTKADAVYQAALDNPLLSNVAYMRTQADFYMESGLTGYSHGFVGPANELVSIPESDTAQVIKAGQYGGNVLRLTGEQYVFTIGTFPVDTAKRYKVKFTVRQHQDSDQSKIYAGVVTLDANYAFISGGAGTHRYCGISSVIHESDGFCTFEGSITGIGDAHDNFRVGTVYVRLVAIVNYRNGTGIADIDELSFYEMTAQGDLIDIGMETVSGSQAKAQAAQSAAESYALAKANLAEITAKAHADGRVDAEEARAIADATAKAEAAKQAAISTAKDDASAKAETAKIEAQEYALAKAALAETTAKAHADGKVDAEEARAIADATAKADAAKQAAISTAKDDASAKAETAKIEAQEYALAKAALAETTAKAHADGRVDAEEARAIADATAKAEAAKQAAINAAALDAEAKAQVAQSAAESYALAKANLAETTAKAHADGRVDAEEARAIADATAKADAAKQAAIDTAALDAAAKANAAQSAAESYALAKANLAETTAKAHADGKVDAAEQRAIADATAKAEAAKQAAINAAAQDATEKADVAEAAANVNTYHMTKKWTREYRASLTNHDPLLFHDGSSLPTLYPDTSNVKAQYSVTLVTVGTGTVTKTVGVLSWTGSAWQWTLISALGSVSNHPRIIVNGSAAPVVATWHNSTYRISVAMEWDCVSTNLVRAGMVESNAIAAEQLYVNNALIEKLIAENGLFLTLQAQLAMFGGLAAEAIAANAITTEKLHVTARNLVNNFTMTDHCEGWSFANSDLVSVNYLGRSVKGAKIVSSGNTIRYSDYFDIDHNKVYEVNISVYRASGGSTGSRYLGIHARGGTESYDTVVRYYASTRMLHSETNNPYFWGGDISTGQWRVMKTYIIGANVDPVTVPDTQNVSYIIQLKADTTQVRLRMLNYSNDGTQTTDYWVNPSVTEIGSGVISANQLLANEGLFNALKVKLAAFGGLTANEIQADSALINKLLANEGLFNSLQVRLAVFGGLTANSIAAGAILGEHIKAGEKITSPILEGGEIRLIGSTHMEVTAATPFGPDDLIQWYGPKLMSGSNPNWNALKKSNAINYKDDRGNCHFGGTLSSGTLKNEGTTSVKTRYTVNSYPLTVGPFSTSGRTKSVVFSYDMSGAGRSNSGSVTTPKLGWQLQRRLGTGSWSTRTSGTFNGTSGSTYMPEFSQYATSESCSGSTTYTDTSSSTEDFTYRIKVTSYARHHSDTDVTKQYLTIIAIEQ
ncbi:hypothetical protein [uncultured Shewanella sp.]|uniref:hypothetical protein n=1 Tax=uncultured Shewanella sp. TaxID=173975 RepID=UPI00260E7531|nr:hypothetical protein [uncultured Shewanella sp.]